MEQQGGSQTAAIVHVIDCIYVTVYCRAECVLFMIIFPTSALFPPKKVFLSTGRFSLDGVTCTL